MKKLFLLLLLLGCYFTTNAANGVIRLKASRFSQVADISPNGKWACGTNSLRDNRAFLWNLETDEIIYLSSSTEKSAAYGVSDNGVVAGAYMNSDVTANGAKLFSGGYWKEGKWYSLEQPKDAPIINQEMGSVGFAISKDGQYITGNFHDAVGIMEPALWKNGKMIKIFDRPLNDENKYGEATGYDVNDAGTMVCGYATTFNRTAYLWTPEPVKLSESGMFPVDEARRFTPNGNYVVGAGQKKPFIYNIQTKEKTELPFLTSQSTGNWGVTWIGDDLTVVGDEGGVATIYPKGGAPMLFSKWLQDKSAPIDGVAFSMGGVMSDNMNVVSANTIENDVAGPHATGFIWIFNTEVDNREPVTLKAEQLPGTQCVQLTWKAPIINGENVKGYKIFRDGVQINNSTLVNGLLFDDLAPVQGNHQYQVSAVYKSGTESVKSAAASIQVKEYIFNAPEQLFGRLSGNSNAFLTWKAPEKSDIKLKYYEGGYNDAFGMNQAGTYYCAVKFSKEMLSRYASQYEITQVSFYPKEATEKFYIQIMAGSELVCNQEVTMDQLVFNTFNSITLKTPVKIQSDKEIMAIIKVVQTYGSNPIGTDAGPAVVGFGDLSRREEDPQFESTFQASEEQLNFNFLIAIGLNGISESGKAILEGYNVYRENQKIATVQETAYQDKTVSQGTHTYSVESIYKKDGKQFFSDPCSPVSIQVTPRGEPCQKPINLKAKVENENEVTLEWELNEVTQTTELSYTNWEPNVEISIQVDLFLAAIDLDKEKVGAYNGFEIKEFKFYPIGDAKFYLIVYTNGDEIYSQEIKQYELNKINTVKLNTPIQINPELTYRIALEVSNFSTNVLAMDRSASFAGKGDMLSEDGILYTSQSISNFVTGNWMMGINAQYAGESPIPFNVYANGAKVNDEPLTSTTFKKKFDSLTAENKEMKMSVSAVYPDCGEKTCDEITVRYNMGVNEQTVPQLTLYPNPASTDLYIDAEAEKVILTNATGQKVFEASNVSKIDVSHLPTGVYLVRIEHNGKAAVAKVCIAR